jgi:hypothetical protein
MIVSVMGGILSSRPVLGQGKVTTEPVVVRADERGLGISWIVPAPTLTSIEAGGTTYTEITLAGLSALALPGHPQLPHYSRLVALPPEGEARLRIISATYDTLSLEYPPLPAPVPREATLAQPQVDGLQVGDPGVIDPDPALYNTNALIPADSAELGNVRQVRGHRLAPLRIHPVRVNPVTGVIMVLTAIDLEVTFSRPASAALLTQETDDFVPFEQALDVTLLNPVGIQWTVAETTSSANSPPLQTADATGDGLTKIIIRDRGLYQLTYDTLAAAGLPVDTLDPRTLLISHGSQFTPVTAFVEGEDDGVLNSGDRLLFYAEPAFSRYTDEDVYFMSYNVSSPPRMAARSGDPQGLPAGTSRRTTASESNSRYEPAYPARDGDHWYWMQLHSLGPKTADFNISLTHPATGGPNATLTIWLQSDIGSSHHVSVRLNGISLGEFTWSSRYPTALTRSLPASLLRDGSNTVQLELKSTGTVLIDAFELTYPFSRAGSGQSLFSGEGSQSAYTVSGWSSSKLHVVDVTAPLTPTILTGTVYTAGSLTLADSQSITHTYLIAPDNKLKSPLRLEPAQIFTAPPNGADYIIVTHPDFAAAVEPLAQHRAAQGLEVVTVDTQTIYDSYGGGRMSPQAIRAFLQDAYLNWTPSTPVYVLLVGDGSYDPKDHTGFHAQTYIPPYLALVDPWLGDTASGRKGETAADNRFVTFEDDNFPVMAIGRLPVNKVSETTIVVNKIIQYETKPFPGDWNMRQLFVGGDHLDDSEPPARSGTFRSHANAAYTTLNPPFIGYRFYYDNDITSSETYFYNDHVALREDFIRSFNRGASVVVFHGHSSVHQWNDQPLFRWSKVSADNDIYQLHNSFRLPVILSMTCFTSFFHHPEFPTLDESVLRRDGGGAIATWGPTGLGVATGHELLQRGFYTSINGGNTNLGAAILTGKSTLAADTFFDHDLVDTFTLFGDPAMALNFTLLPFSNEQHVPLILK